MDERHRKRNRFDLLRPILRLTNRLEAAQLRFAGTSGMRVLRRTPVLLLETTGRRTGRLRRAPVAYWEGADGDLYIGGGAAGMTRVDWVANLRADPRAHVWIRRRRIPVTARELQGEEYERVSAEAFERWPAAPGYERRSGRPIPFFRLRRRPTRGAEPPFSPGRR